MLALPGKGNAPKAGGQAVLSGPLPTWHQSSLAREPGPELSLGQGGLEQRGGWPCRLHVHMAVCARVASCWRAWAAGNEVRLSVSLSFRMTS